MSEIPPTRLFATRLSRGLYRMLARHSDARLVRMARRCAEASTAVLHSENTDPETNGEYEVLRRLGPDALHTVVDVGANHGRWSRAVLRLQPSAVVYCSEISEPTRRVLREAVPEAVVLEHGLLDRDGEVTRQALPRRRPAVLDLRLPAPVASNMAQRTRHDRRPARR